MMKMLGLSSNLAIAVLVYLALALPQVASADDTCPAGYDCVGPEISPYRYQVADGYIGLAQGADQASTIAAYKQQVQTNYHTCTFDLTDNLPAWQPPQAGHGGAQQGDYNAALFAGQGQYWSAAWTLSTSTSSTIIPLVLTGTYPSTGSPPCQGTFGQRGVYVQRGRTVTCPNFYVPNANTPNAPNNAFCYRQATARRPAKNLGSPCPACGNPINPSSGNKFQEETDYVGPGPMPLRFVRYYNNQRWTGIYGPWVSGAFNLYSNVGPNWTTSYDRVIRFSDGILYPTAYAYRPDGRTLYFKLVNGQFAADADTADRLVRLMDGSGNPTGWRYTIASTEEVETYDNSGKLLSIASREGATQTLGYDSAGRLATITDAFGRALTLAYDTNGRLGSLTDPDGKVSTYQYNAATNMSSVAYPGGTSRNYVYNESANTSGGNFPFAMTGIVDEAGVRFATFKYNVNELAIFTEHAGSVDRYTLTFAGSPSPTQATVTDPLGLQQLYTFSTLHGVAKVATLADLCSGCATITNSYDANGNLASRTDKNGNITNYSYDLTRNLETSRTEAYGTPRARTITTTWHSTFRLPTQIDEPGKRTTFTHDANGNVLTKTVLDTATSDSRTWTYTYNAFGQVLTADGPRTDVSDVTTYTYYSCTTGYQCGQVQTITNALGHVTTYNTYNAHGQPLTITDPNGVVTTLTYDLRRRLTSRTVGSEQTTFDYWPTGLLKKATLPDGTFLEYAYDAAHRLTEIEDSEGNRIVYTLDNMGNRTAENLYDPSSTLTQTRTRVFNTLNRLWKEIGAAGTANVTTVFAYDNNGNQTTINAPLSRNTVQAYDELNRLKQVTDPLSGVTQYGYNALDQLLSVTDPRNKVTSYIYNALGDLTQQVSPDTGTTTNTYDSGGNLATSTDARSKTGTYAYDALNRVTSLTYADQTISYTYDSGTNQKGLLTQVSDASGSTTWSYDTQGRVLSRQQNMGVTKTLAYAYDSAGRLQTLTLPSGNTVTYGYADGKVTSLTLNGSTTILSNVLYQPFGPTRGWTWGNSSLAVREYDTDGKITDIDSAGLKTYSYDDAFRITQITDVANSSLTQSYGYDLLDRLTSATGASLNQLWTYDANGNRLTQTGSAASTYAISSTSNRLSGVSGALSRTYSYDNSGNTASDGTTSFTYNDAGRMISATKASVTTTYTLNSLGQRVKKTTSGSSTYFVYDEAGHLVGEYDNAGNFIQETLWFGDTAVATLRPNGAGVDLFYVHTDHLNTPRRISRPSDNVVIWRWDSDPFGTSAANEDPDGDSNLFAYNLRFPGQYLDTETGLHYNYMRYFDPEMGRYVQSDPIGLRGGTNTYLYVLGDPVRKTDPSGLLSRGSDVSDALWDEVQKAEKKIRDELSRSCFCQASGPEGCIPCNYVADLLSSLDTTVIYGAMIPGACGKAQILGRYIQLTPDALVPSKCGCVASTVYHELLHTIGWGHTGRNGRDPATEMEQTCQGNLCK